MCVEEINAKVIRRKREAVPGKTRERERENKEKVLGWLDRDI